MRRSFRCEIGRARCAKALAAAFLAALATLPAAAREARRALRLEFVLERAGAEPEPVTWWIAEGGVRIQPGPQSELLFLREGPKLFLIDRVHRSYVDLEREVLDPLRAMRRQVEEQLKLATPEERAALERSLGPALATLLGTGPPPPLCDELQVLSEESVAQVPARVVEGCRGLVGGSWEHVRLWVADGAALGLTEGEMEALEAFAGLARRLLGLQGADPLHELDFAVQPGRDELAALGIALPLVVKQARLRGAHETRALVLRRASERELAPGELALPDGFQPAGRGSGLAPAPPPARR